MMMEGAVMVLTDVIEAIKLRSVSICGVNVVSSDDLIKHFSRLKSNLEKDIKIIKARQ